MSETTLLPKSKEEAIRTIISVTQKLTKILEEETNKFTMNDTVGVIALEKQKEEAYQQYNQVAREFSERSEEFVGIKTTYLDQLEAAQQTLSKVTNDNLKITKKAMEGTAKRLDSKGALKVDKEDNND